MKSGWRVGSLFGIPLYIDLSWFLIVLLIALPMGMQWQREYADWGTPVAYGAALLMSLLFFASVLLHELGHSLVALAQGIKVNSITLFLFGGIASIEQESKTPGKAFQVAIAGPAVSFLLAIGLALVALAIPDRTSPAYIVAQSLSGTNLVLALFNLLPGLPLDGGQVLKALVWKVTGSRFKGVRWAARSGALLGWSAIMLGVFAFLSGGSGGLWLALLGWFGVKNAGAYDWMTTIQEVLLSLKASDAMTREFRVVDATMPLSQFVDKYITGKPYPEVFYASSDGRYRGLVAEDHLQSLERSQWETQNLFSIIQPLDNIPTTAEASQLAEVIRRMEADAMRRMTVLSPAGAVAGVIDRGDIVRALAQKLRLPIADSLIKQIKEEGAYPPGFPLGDIATAALQSAES
jgi:Zn-dependent protease